VLWFENGYDITLTHGWFESNGCNREELSDSFAGTSRVRTSGSLTHMCKRMAGLVARMTVGFLVMGILMLTPQAAARPALSLPAAGYGFGDGAAMQYMAIGDVNRELDAVAKTGASWLRILIDWSAIERVKGEYDWGYVDGLVTAARAHDLRVLGVIAYSPAWARPADAYYTSPPTDPADYGRFAATVAGRYSDRVSDWELWNEPNLPPFFGYLTDDNPARYTALIKAAYPAIKSAQPNGTVVLAGSSPMLGDYSPPAFLDQMYAAGAGGFFDAAAAHPYVSPSGIDADPVNGWSDVGRMHDVMVAHGDGDKKIWLTEFGAATSESPEGVSQAEQAKQITDVLAAAAATDYSGPAFIYSIRDEDTRNQASGYGNYGALLTSDWQPKATAAALAK
jgi:hypothetical protein